MENCEETESRQSSRGRALAEFNQYKKLREEAFIAEFDCKHLRTEMRTRRVSAIEIVDQCIDCGRRVGSVSYPRSKFDPRKVPEFDNELREATRVRYISARDALTQELRAKRVHLYRTYYHEYLSSVEWQVKRELVLKRDDSLCQGCRASEAVHVHHLTYEHVFEELAFELISLCETCHIAIEHA